MINQYHLSGTNSSPQDSFQTNPTAHHTAPLHPPRSSASRLSKGSATNPTSLTAETLAKLPSSNDENATALYNHARIINFLHNLPAVQDPTDPNLAPDFDVVEREEQQPRRNFYTPPFDPRHCNVFHRFQEMKQRQPEAGFERHNAWLVLEFMESGEVSLRVGVESREHAEGIHGLMCWLRDKWLGREVDVRYHIVEYDEEPQGQGGDKSETATSRDGKPEKVAR